MSMALVVFVAAAVAAPADNAKSLGHADPAVRRRAVTALVLAGADAGPVLIAAVGSTNADERRAALAALIRLGPTAGPAVPALTAALADPEPDIRIRAAVALARQGAGAKPAVPALVALAADTAGPGDRKFDRMPQLVAEAAIVAALAGDPDAGPALARTALGPLTAMLQSDHAPDAGRAAAALAALGRHAAPAVPAIEAANEKHGEPAGNAYEKALLAIGRDPAEPYRRRLADPATTDETRRRTLERMPRCVGEPATIAAAVRAGLTAQSALVRREALWVLRTQKPVAKLVLPTLAGMLDDKGVRKEGGDGLIWDTLGLAGPAAAPVLAAAVADERRADESRLRAVNTLADFGPGAAPARAALLAASEDINPVLAGAAACAYVAAGGDPERVLAVIRACLKSPIIESQCYTAEAVGRTGPKLGAAAPAVAALLTHPADRIRAEAATALGRLGPAAVPTVPAIAERIRSGTRTEAADAAFALRQFGPAAAAAAPALAERIAKEKGGDAFLIGAVLEIGPPAKAAGPALLKYLETGPNPDMEYLTLKALCQVGPGPEALPAFSARLDSPDERTRAAAAHGLGLLGPAAAAAVPTLKALRAGDRPMVRLWAAVALHRIAGEPAPDAAFFEDLWHDTDADDGFGTALHQAALAESMLDLGPYAKPFRDRILVCIADPATSLAAAERLCETLARLPDDAAGIVPKLAPLLDRAWPSDDGPLAVVECLGAFGPAAAAAVPALERVRAGDNGRLARAAAAALGKIIAK